MKIFNPNGAEGVLCPQFLNGNFSPKKGSLGLKFLEFSFLSKSWAHCAPRTQDTL